MYSLTWKQTFPIEGNYTVKIKVKSLFLVLKVR